MHGHAQGDPEIAHGQAERQAADPPQDAEEIGPEQAPIGASARTRSRSGTWTRANAQVAMIQLNTPPTSHDDSHDQPFTPRNTR